LYFPMPSFFKTVVISALVACPTVFVTASAAGDGKNDENKDKKEEKKDKKSGKSNTEKLVTFVATFFPKLSKDDHKAISSTYASAVHGVAADAHSMVDENIKAKGLNNVIGVRNMQFASEDAALPAAFAHIKDLTAKVKQLATDVKADDPTLVDKFKTDTKIEDTDSKFDERVKPLVARLVTAVRSVIEYNAECLLGLCDEKALKAIQEEAKKEAEKQKNKKPEEPKKDDKKEDDKLSVDKALKKFEADYVVNVEKEAKKLFAATRIGSIEKKIKDQKASNSSLALGLGLGLGLGLPFLFGIGIFAAMKAGCLQYNPVA